jgi:hypothetical protein
MVNGSLPSQVRFLTTPRSALSTMDSREQGGTMKIKLVIAASAVIAGVGMIVKAIIEGVTG